MNLKVRIKRILVRVIRWLRRQLSLINYKITKNKVLSDTFDKTILEKAWHNKKITCISDESLSEATIDLSLIVPLYNSVKFMPKCLDSLLSQNTKYKYEIILVNDGSKDETENVAKSYCEKYPDKARLISQENQGISAARNTGLINSRGRYIGFIDHDDWVDSTYVEKLMHEAYKVDADIVKCSYLVVGEKTTVNCGSPEVIIGPMKAKLYDYRGYVWGGVYSRSLLEHVRFPRGYWYEDMITRTLLYQQSMKFCNVGEVLYYKLEHNNNASKKVWSNSNYKCLEQIYLPESLISDCIKLGIEQDVWMYQCILLEYASLLASRTNRLPQNVRKQAFLYASSVLKEHYRDEFDNEMTYECKKWNRIILEKRYDAWRNLAKMSL